MKVRELENENCSKLVHLMKYIRYTKNLSRIMSANGSGKLKWWIYGSFMVHPNMSRKTSGGISMGRGFPIFSSIKHNLNMQSSTEIKIVAVYNCMHAFLWIRYSLDAQKYDVFENIVYQDNKTDILLENNGKVSISKRKKEKKTPYTIS